MDEEELKLRKREIEIAIRRLELDENIWNKYSSAIISTVVALSVAGLGFIQWKTSHDAEQRQEAFQNEALAIEIYYKYNNLFADNNDMSELNFNILRNIITDNNTIAKIDEARIQAISSGISNAITDELSYASFKTGNTPLTQLSNVKVPTVIVPTDSATSNFTVYIQYPEDCFKQAQKIEFAIKDAGFNVPGLESIAPENMPDRSDIRFYTTNQRENFFKTIQEIGNGLEISFKPTLFKDQSLPEDIFEIWIGNEDCLAEAQ